MGGVGEGIKEREKVGRDETNFYTFTITHAHTVFTLGRDRALGSTPPPPPPEFHPQ